MRVSASGRRRDHPVSTMVDGPCARSGYEAVDGAASCRFRRSIVHVGSLARGSNAPQSFALAAGRFGVEPSLATGAGCKSSRYSTTTHVAVARINPTSSTTRMGKPNLACRASRVRHAARPLRFRVLLLARSRVSMLFHVFLLRRFRFPCRNGAEAREGAALTSAVQTCVGLMVATDISPARIPLRRPVTPCSTSMTAYSFSERKALA